MLKDLLRFLFDQIDVVFVFTVTDQERKFSVRRRELHFFCRIIFSIAEREVGEAVGSSALTVYTTVTKIAPRTQTSNQLVSFTFACFTNPSVL